MPGESLSEGMVRSVMHGGWGWLASATSVAACGGLTTAAVSCVLRELRSPVVSICVHCFAWERRVSLVC